MSIQHLVTLIFVSGSLRHQGPGHVIPKLMVAHTKIFCIRKHNLVDFFFFTFLEGEVPGHFR